MNQTTDTDRYEITDGAFDLIQTLGENTQMWLLALGDVTFPELEVLSSLITPTGVALTVDFPHVGQVKMVVPHAMLLTVTSK